MQIRAQFHHLLQKLLVLVLGECIIVIGQNYCLPEAVFCFVSAFLLFSGMLCIALAACPFVESLSVGV